MGSLSIAAPNLWKIRDWTVDLQHRRLERIDGVTVGLSETEAAVLCYLLVHRSRVVSRAELLRQVWGIPTEGLTTRTVDMHIARLRAKLRSATADLAASDAIVTVRSQGYQAGPAWQNLSHPAATTTVPC